LSAKVNLPVKDKLWAVVEHRDGHIEVHGSKGKTVTDDGLDWVVNRWDLDSYNKMAYMAVGSGTNTPDASDTELQTELLRKTFSVQTNPSTGKKHWEIIIDFSELNGETLTEVGVFEDPETGIMFLRKLLSPSIEKTSDKKVTLIVEVTLARA